MKYNQSKLKKIIYKILLGMFLTMVGILGLELGFSKLRDDWKNSEELKEKRREIFFQREKQILNEKKITGCFGETVN